MKNRNPKARSGLILLVVLSMLTLFSLLSITYVVFSSQARSASMGMARKDFRGTPPATLMDESIRQVLRGADSKSVLWKHSILEDLYGSGTSDLFNSPNENWIQLVPRTDSRDNPARSAMFAPGTWDLPNLPAVKGNLEAPQLLGSRMVNIPLQWRDDSAATIRSWLPEQHDVWNGRVVSFLEGPLVGRSFRVVRYMGEINDLTSALRKYPQSVQYSITIDLSDLPQSFSSYLLDSSSVYALFYNGSVPYQMLLNAGVLNAFGAGVAMDGTVQKTSAASKIGFLSKLTPPLDQLSGTYANIETALLPNYSYAKLPNSTFSPSGDSDESWDAADYANFFISYKFPPSGSTVPTDDIIPSYHRPAIVNHIYSKVVSTVPLPSFTPYDLFSTIELLQRATARPLSFTVRNLPGPDFNIYNNVVSQNPNFSGSNLGDYAGTAPLTPELDIDWAQWNASPSIEQLKFQGWVRWLQRGPWDVDNDGDGTTDSIWKDLNLPLMTSPEGKLLKMMAAVYVEDLGSRLSLNASGNAEQASSTFSGFDASDGRFAYYSLSGSQLPQGFGLGTADISLRHLFPNTAAGDAKYLRFIHERYGANSNTLPANFTSFTPGANPVSGVPTNDSASQLRERHRSNHNPNALPGLPLSVFGRSGLGIDLFGNPLIYDDVATNEINDDPYESRLTSSYRDSLFTVPEWERLYRSNDWDRSTLPERLESLMGLAGANAVTPVSNSLIAAKAGGSYKYSHLNPNGTGIETVTRRVSSFAELLEAIAQKRFSPGTYPYFNESALAQLLPLEFRHNIPLDPNRPIGNGFDDDGDNLIDEQDELSSVVQYAEYPAGTSSGIAEQYSNATGSFDLAYDGLPAGLVKTRFNGNQGRQLLARHLYCLAQLILPDNYVFPNTDPISTYKYGDPERARILAQWAVNVVDFRDADGAMTRFPYDSDPFTSKSWVPDDGVVWGQEQPEMLITESLAFHDLRINVKDSPPAPPGTNKWQQLRIPEGSLFLELMSTRSGGNRSGSGGGSTIQRPGVPRGNLYDANGDLNVSAVSPPDDTTPTPNRFPVWRILLTDPLPKVNATDSVNSKYETASSRNTMEYQTELTAGLRWDKTSSTPPTVNRVVWFARDPISGNGFKPTATNLALSSLIPEKVYYNRSGVNVSLQPGQYLLAGPRVDTYVGQREQTNAPLKHRPSAHRIQLQTGWTQVWSDLNYPDIWLGTTPPFPLPVGEPQPQPSAFLRSSFPLVVAADPPVGSTAITQVGLNISEPTPDSYYVDPTDQLNKNDSAADPLTGSPGFQNLPKDAYVDLTAAGNSPHPPLDLNTSFPLGKAGNWGIQTGTDARPNVESRSDWSTALLQRLANPDQPWHDTFNPYVTVDWLPIDLTVFSGEYPIKPDTTPIHFGSRQKTGLYANIMDDVQKTVTDPQLPDRAGRSFYSYHSEEFPERIYVAGGPNEPHVGFTMPLEYADRPMTLDIPVDRLNASFKNVGDFTTLGYLNSRFGLRGMKSETTHGDYLGSAVFYPTGTTTPQPVVAPFWANRDFASNFELMNVPLSSPGQFMQEFTVAPTTGEVPFKHTLDFEMTYAPNSSLTSKPASQLLELIAPRNPWVDAEATLNPTQVYAPSPANDQAQLTNEVLLIYRPPFNRVPRFIEPGKVNMNTAAQESVFRGLMWSALTPASTRNTVSPIPFQAAFNASRSYLSPSSPLPFPNARLDGSIPTEFPGIMKSGFSNPVSYLGLQTTYNTISSSLLRTNVAGTGRLFASTDMITLSGGTQLPHNTFVTNQAVSRLANLTTDQSNVFAVRITVGYFEYDPSGGGLGAEYGLDEGKVRRHRAFYVIDRSVPVAYQEGQDLNTENCILVRRIIE